MHYFAVLVIVSFGAWPSVDALLSSCSKYTCDRQLMGKLLILEIQKKASDSKITDLEGAIESLENDLTQLGDSMDAAVAAAVSAATANAIIKPDVEFDGWNLLFRATAGNGDNVFDAWQSGTGVTATKPTDMKISNGPHYLDLNAANDWATFSAMTGAKARYSLFKNELEVFYIVFDAEGSTRDSWFDDAKVLESSSPILTEAGQSYNYFSIAGHAEVLRRFFINENYGGCPADKGFTVIVDIGTPTQPICQFDQQPDAVKPQILYTRINGADIWERHNYGRADYAAVYYKVDP